MLLRQQSFRFLLLASTLRLSVRHCRSGAALRAKAPPFGYLAPLDSLLLSSTRRSALPPMATTSSACAVRRLCVQRMNASRKRCRVERGEEAVEGVVAGDAIGQFQKSAQPRRLGVAEKLHVLEALRPAEQRADGDDQDVLELVQPGALNARIGQFTQDAQEIGSLGGREFESGHPKRASEPTLKAQ